MNLYDHVSKEEHQTHAEVENPKPQRRHNAYSEYASCSDPDNVGQRTH